MKPEYLNPPAAHEQFLPVPPIGPTRGELLAELNRARAWRMFLTVSALGGWATAFILAVLR